MDRWPRSEPAASIRRQQRGKAARHPMQQAPWLGTVISLSFAVCQATSTTARVSAESTWSAIRDVSAKRQHVVLPGATLKAGHDQRVSIPLEAEHLIVMPDVQPV